MSKKWYVYKTAAELESRDGNLPASEKLWLAALEEAEDLALNDPRLLVTLESLTEIYFEQKHFLQSAAVGRRILQIYLTTLGPNHPDVGTMASNVAMIYRYWQRLDKAIEFYERALQCHSACFGEDDERVVGLKKELEEAQQELKRGPKLGAREGRRMTRTGRWETVPAQPETSL